MFIVPAGSPNIGYQIPRSLRFRSGASASLNKTFSGAGTSAQKFTVSLWTKRCKFATETGIFTADTGGGTAEGLVWSTGDQLGFDTASGATVNLRTPGVFRDPSAWYHIVCSVDTTAASGSRVKLYVNGSQQTSLTGTEPTSSQSFTKLLQAINHNIGAYRAGVEYADDYKAEMYVVDGQALTPSSFGQTDATTGAWNPIKYTGTYGTNGFYLPFSDNSAATSTTIGKDSSGNGNNWTPSGISITAGVTNDSLVDTPTNYGTDTGAGGEVRGNYCTLNPLNQNSTGITLANGNLDVNRSGAGNGQVWATHGMSTGKWYAELTCGTDIAELIPGIANGNMVAGDRYLGQDSNTYGYYYDGRKINAASYVAYGNTYASGDVIGVIFDADNGKLYWSKNGTVQATGNPVSGTNAAYTGLTSGPYFFAVSSESATTASSWNFGQRPFAYTAPTGFKALCTQNLPVPAIVKPSSYMDVNLRTGSGSAGSVSGKGFQPDFVWSKSRSARSHMLADSVRGTGKYMSSDSSGIETSDAQAVTAFNSDGFSFGTSAILNTNAESFADWLWKKGALPGFDVVGYTGNGSGGQAVSHALGAVPSFVILKNRTTAGQSWVTYHSSIGSPTGNYMQLNSSAAVAAASGFLTPSSTQLVFTTSYGGNNNNGDTYVAYCFAEVAGFSKFGSYTGNGSADGPFVWCGFRPRFVLFKSTGAGEYWHIGDTARSTYNVVDAALRPNLSNAEALFSTSVETWDILSNGFKLRGTGGGNNASAVTYIFAAFAESPFKTARAA